MSSNPVTLQKDKKLTNPLPQVRLPLPRKFIAPLIGAILYALLGWLTTIFPLAAAGDVNIRPGVVVPIFFGFAFGPWVGFFTGMAGNIMGDLLSGAVSFPVPVVSDSAFINFAMGTYLPWQLGNGLMGLIPGLARRFIPRFHKLKDHLLALGVAILGIVAGMGVASLLTVALGLDANFVFSQYFIPAVWSNTYNVIFALPVLLYNFEYFNTGAFKAFRSRFVRRLLFLILSAAGLPIVFLGLFLLQPDMGNPANSGQADILFKLLFTIIVTMLFVVVNASMMAQRLSSVMVSLTDAAQFMERDELSAGDIDKLKTTPGDDEISQLCRVFGQMAQETRQRQENMRRQIRQLHIQIDEKKTANQVASIMDTDYFQQLEQKIDTLRLNLRR